MRQNIPTAESATPTRSKRWSFEGRRGMKANPSTNPRIPTGTLMKKIHSQPPASTSTPPARGPTSIATPAVAPPQRHRLAPPIGGEGAGDDRHRLRGHHRGAEALDGAGEDEGADRAGERTPQGGEGEHHQPGEVDRARAELVPEPPGDEQ